MSFCGRDRGWEVGLGGGGCGRAVYVVKKKNWK